MPVLLVHGKDDIREVLPPPESAKEPKPGEVKKVFFSGKKNFKKVRISSLLLLCLVR